MPPKVKKRTQPSTDKKSSATKTPVSRKASAKKSSVKFVASKAAEEELDARQQQALLIAEQERRIKDEAIPLGSIVSKRRTYQFTEPPKRAEFDSATASPEQVNIVLKRVMYETITRNLTVLTNDAGLSKQIADDMILNASEETIDKVYTFLEYCRYVGVKNIGLNNPLRPSTNSIVAVTNRNYAKVISPSLRQQIDSELSAAIRRKLYPLASIPTRPSRFDVPLNAEPVDFGIPDLELAPITVNVENVVQNSESISSLDDRVLQHAVENGIAKFHTKEYIRVRDHLDAFLNPVRVAKDFSKELEKIRATLSKNKNKSGLTKEEKDEEARLEKERMALLDATDEEEFEGFAPKQKCDRKSCSNDVNPTYRTVKVCNDGKYKPIGFCSSKCMVKSKAV